MKKLAFILILAFVAYPLGSRQLSTADEKTKTNTSCNFSKLEKDFFQILNSDRKQRRKNLKCHPTLLKLARERAQDMAKRRYFSHTNPDGYGPNYLLKKMGYKLPKWWGNKPKSNFIESISAGRSSAQAAYTGWMNSPGHRKHVLGTSNFYGSQSNVAIGHYRSPGSKYKDYWVFISAPPEK